MDLAVLITGLAVSVCQALTAEGEKSLLAPLGATPVLHFVVVS
jgi:CBS-domain-containing membrane protein